MISGEPPRPLVLFREGCAALAEGDTDRGVRLLKEAKALTEGSVGEPFETHLREQIVRRLSACAESRTHDRSHPVS